MQKTVLKSATKAQMEKRIKEMKKRGWEPLLDEPKFDPGYTNITNDCYVMVMQHKTLERTGTKKWGYR